MGNLVKMKITAYSDEKFTSKVGKDYELMLNPETLKWDRSVEYNEQQSLDSSKPSSKYKETPGEVLSFDTLLDCTGVVDSSRVDLQAEVDQLRKAVYDYNGTIHRPNFVQVTWGSSLSFQGVLKSFDITYTLFKPDGSPLRAKLSLKFGSYVDPASAAKKEGKSSPDLTHLVEVVGGDTLPQLSMRVFNTTEYYVQLAQYNGLNKFRHLKAGQTLVFPPIVSEAAQ